MLGIGRARTEGEASETGVASADCIEALAETVAVVGGNSDAVVGSQRRVQELKKLEFLSSLVHGTYSESESGSSSQTSESSPKSYSTVIFGALPQASAT